MGEPEVYLITKLIAICTGNGDRKHRANLRRDKSEPFVKFIAFEGLAGLSFIYS